MEMDFKSFSCINNSSDFQLPIHFGGILWVDDAASLGAAHSGHNLTQGEFLSVRRSTKLLERNGRNHTTMPIVSSPSCFWDGLSTSATTNFMYCTSSKKYLTGIGVAKEGWLSFLQGFSAKKKKEKLYQIPNLIISVLPISSQPFGILMYTPTIASDLEVKSKLFKLLFNRLTPIERSAIEWGAIELTSKKCWVPLWKKARGAVPASCGWWSLVVGSQMSEKVNAIWCPINFKH